ncbi:MAG: hypothetical protein FJW90_04200 [Actinobacteria bacterium]|nr:hypothetical protein [Actinomycetota bacterium]
MLAIWIVAMIALAPLGGKLADETVDDTESFLPESAESTEVVRILDDEFAAGETTNGIVVYKRDGGLTPADERKIAADAVAMEAAGAEELPLTEPPVVSFQPGAPETLAAADGDLATTIVTVPTDFESSADWGKFIRDTVEED